jgi:hypothetical protein
MSGSVPSCSMRGGSNGGDAEVKEHSSERLVGRCEVEVLQMCE